MRPALLAATSPSEEWGEDEVFLLIVSIIISFFGGRAWLRAMAATPRMGRGRFVVLSLVVSLAATLALLGYVTWFWTAKEIRGGKAYAWLAVAMGTAWLSIAGAMFRWLGVGLRDDACERRNPAAALALSGAMPGAMLIYCGSTSGEGPSFWNNVFSTLVGGVGWLVTWLILSATSGGQRAISEDRDVASGMRLGAFLLALGLVIGRALAGNWHSEFATVRDLLRDGWPGLVLLILAVVGQRYFRPTPENPRPSVPIAGFVPALLYLSLAITWAARLGWWEGIPE